MNQFDKHIHIPLNPSSTDSIRHALVRYQELLQSGDAFRQEFGLMFNVEFVAETENGHRRLQPDDAGKNQKLLAFALEITREGTHKEVEADEETYISEPILFARALTYPELTPELLRTAEAMVAFARRRNDSADFWVDDMYVFGLEALFMLAIEHEETAWLLASFLIPYWDTEHEHAHAELMPILVQAGGWTRDLIKAYVYCDNTEVRRTFNHPGNTPDLADYLQQHPEDYDWFCNQLAERLRRQPLLAHPGEAPKGEAFPVLTFFHTLRARWPVDADPYDEGDWIDEVSQLPFLDTTLEGAALAVFETVQQQTSSPLMVVAEAHQEDDECGEPFGNRFENALSFVGNLNNGPDLRRYVLGELTPDQAIELLARIKPYDFDAMGRFGTGPDTLYPFIVNLTDWLEPPFATADVIANFHDYFASLLPSLRANTEGAERNENALRMLDVFWRALGCPQFPYRLLEKLQEWSLLSEADYRQRYQQQPAADDQRFVAFAHSLDRLNHSGEALQLARLQTLDDKVAGHKALLDPGHWPSHLGALTYATWCAQSLTVADKPAQQLTAWLEARLPEAMYDALSDWADSDTLPPQLREYLTDRQPAPFDSAIHQDMFRMLESSLHRDGGRSGPRVSDQQPAYALFQFEGGFQLPLLSLFWLQVAGWLSRVSPELMLLRERWWRLMLDLAPQKVIRQILKLHSNYPLYQGIDDPALENTLHNQLTKSGVREAELDVFQLCSDAQVAGYRPANERYWQRYVGQLDHFGEIDPEDRSMLGASARRQYADMLEALRKREDRDRIRFFTDLRSRHPDAPLPDWLEADFEQALTEYLVANSKVDKGLEWDQVGPAKRKVGEETAAQVLAYLNASEPSPDRKAIQTRLKKTLDQQLSSDTTAETLAGPQFYLWGLLDEVRSNRLLTLMLNHSRTGLKMLDWQALHPTYVHHLIQSSELTMEERWHHEIVGHNSISDPDVSQELYRRAAAWALQKLEPLDIPDALRLAFAFENGMTDYLFERASQGPLPDLSKALNGKDRQRLAELLGTRSEACEPGLASLLKDSSRAVAALASRYLSK
ncbi:hypothetical protein [Marinobacter zhejiangensis]|uniref:Uncharacterized protein n=1 Tax=Marinobacter zhejiangensis TaxID=488535 RepID=A0A1I4SZJ9_9GAMM|nr:hypothetical protein [Marinobacter zhejiangensis]SFM69892.1 hypothetical protein SAMN04487963_3407 [Marinobacter zhejiangensis]